MQTVINAEYHYKVHYAEHFYAECLDKLENAQPCTDVGITSWEVWLPMQRIASQNYQNFCIIGKTFLIVTFFIFLNI
jgi:hypothetical protein